MSCGLVIILKDSEYFFLISRVVRLKLQEEKAIAFMVSFKFIPLVSTLH